MNNEEQREELKLDVLDPREEMAIITCRWDGDTGPAGECYLGDQPGPG